MTSVGNAEQWLSVLQQKVLKLPWLEQLLFPVVCVARRLSVDNEDPYIILQKDSLKEIWLSESNLMSTAFICVVIL